MIKTLETVTLFHATGSQALMGMVECGSILPPAITGITANGLAEREVNTLIPSGNQQGVYLGVEDSMFDYLATSNLNTHFDTRYPNLSVVLEVEVDTDVLVPDHDDLAFNSKTASTWEESMEEIGQVVHHGAISVEKIKSVQFTFHLPNYCLPGTLVGKACFMYMISLMNDCGIYADTKYSASEAFALLKEMNVTVEEFYA